MGGLASVAFERAHYAEALDYARRASRLAPQSAKHLLLLGDAYFKLVRYPEALTAYEKAQKLASDSPTVASRLERVRARLGSP
jgi:Flp pilus assembly protein TadD